MFDAVSAQLLRAAPSVPGLDAQSIPAQLTRFYADLVSARLRGASTTIDDSAEQWPASRIADTYELITSLQTEGANRRAAAFVAGTAQQILARRQLAAAAQDTLPPNINRDRVDPSIAAPLLFLAAEQYADAHEAASLVRSEKADQLHEATLLSEHIADLAHGQLRPILNRAGRWRVRTRGRTLEDRAIGALLETLAVGVEMIAARFLGMPIPERAAGRFDAAREAFERVLQVSAVSVDAHPELGGKFISTYAGPHHLASLLIAAHDGIKDASLTSLPPPAGADTAKWNKWLRGTAEKFPFVWRNHRDAIAKGFYETGKSAVMVLPTGAGKTSVSSLKMAGTLARGKKIVFLAPTHALVEQLTRELKEVFPKDVFGSSVSSDFDLLFQTSAKLQEIEVMTPERCLAMLSFAPDAFSDVGLLVFDECHMLSPQSGKIRRAIDGMLCVLSFNRIAPDADMLFLSAMLKDSGRFAAWLEDLTGRPCVSVDILWKPSRQARGALIYRKEELDAAKDIALAIHKSEDKKKGKKNKTLRAVAAKKLVAEPWAIWGLEHNWLDEQNLTANITMLQVMNDAVPLAGKLGFNRIDLTPNANQVAARIAAAAARQGLKSIVFVNTKHDAVSVARTISDQLGESLVATETEQEYWDALEADLGSLDHSLISHPSIAVPHNSSMLRLERELAERMFKRVDGAKVIVATPTLAQGLNLPAQLAILAGDKRADADKKGRQELEAHEILNAAARAGRAGHLANGVVLLIPEPIITFAKEQPLDGDVVSKLQSVLPEDDRCVTISDPLEIVLDRLMQGNSVDPDVLYVVNRMAALQESEGSDSPDAVIDLRRSLGAFAARQRNAEEEFEAKIAILRNEVAHNTPDGIDSIVVQLASRSGLSMDLLVRLRARVTAHIGALPETISDWMVWAIQWLIEDHDARTALLADIKRSVLGACGAKKDSALEAGQIKDLIPGVRAWLEGKPLVEIEMKLGGSPKSEKGRHCPRARELVGTVIPRSLSFVMGLVSHVVLEADPFEQQESLEREVVEYLGTAVRKGYDTVDKVIFAGEHPDILSRVRMHAMYDQEYNED
jgi:superfamily II DNA/RNA helicase